MLVIGEISNIAFRTAWRCRCDCGNIKDIKSEALKSGDTKSCGCLNIEKRKERSYKLYSSLRKLDPVTATAKRVWKRNYKELAFEDFLKLSQQNCYYCGAIPNNKQNSLLYVIQKVLDQLIHIFLYYLIQNFWISLIHKFLD